VPVCVCEQLKQHLQLQQCTKATATTAATTTTTTHRHQQQQRTPTQNIQVSLAKENRGSP